MNGILKEEAHQQITQFRKKWAVYKSARSCCLSAGIALLVVGLLYNLFHFPLPVTVLAFLVISAGFFLWTGLLKQTTATDTARLLNSLYPQLEESSELVLLAPSSLNVLQQLQQARVLNQLQQTQFPAEIVKKYRIAVAFFLLAVCVSVLLFKFPISRHTLFSADVAADAKEKEIRLPSITSVSIKTVPPAYTGKPSREQTQFGLTVEQDAEVQWRIQTRGNIHSVSLIMNDKETLVLHPLDSDKTSWSAKKKVTAPGFYQVKIDEKLSVLYKLEVIADQPAVIRILKPKQYSTIDFGRPQKVNLEVTITDDYGIKAAQIMATVASGQGEAVKFTEQKITFNAGFTGKTQRADLSRTIDLRTLKMQPGDELYYYVEALDNHNQHSRTDMYFVSIQDTAELLSMDGLLGGVNQAPEYFRSQRQLIIDTEKLIREKSSIAKETFNSRSNDLGTDQKLLRLRYGKFLGGENEEGAGAEKDEDDPKQEEASFYSPQQKEKLVSTLNEMWSAEVKLKLYDPVTALPFEYKALRLLKEVQQSSRAYVAKTNTKMPPLKPEKRLTGDLDKIINPVSLTERKPDNDPLSVFRTAAPVLEQLKSGEKLGQADLSILRIAAAELGKLAAGHPEHYLDAAAALRNLVNELQQNKATFQRVKRIQIAFQQLFPAVDPVPGNPGGAPSPGLSTTYFNNLSSRP